MARFVQPQLVTASTPSSSRRAGNPGRKAAVDSSRSLAALLMAAVLAALLVVADQLIDTWADGHLMLAWVLLWCVAFAALAWLAVPLRRLTTGVAHTLQAMWSQYREAQAEQALWELAKGDRRVLAELMAARDRQQLV